MEIIILSFIVAISLLIISSRIFGLGFVCKHAVWFDIAYTFGLPSLFLGTFSGMATAFLAGVFFSIITIILKPCFTVRLTNTNHQPRAL